MGLVGELEDAGRNLLKSHWGDQFAQLADGENIFLTTRDGNNALHIAANTLNFGSAAVYFEHPVFDRLQQKLNTQGELPLHSLPPVAVGSPAIQTQLALRSLLSATREQRALALIWCYDQDVIPLLPRDTLLSFDFFSLPLFSLVRASRLLLCAGPVF